MKKLLVYMKGNVRDCILGPLFKMLEATFELIVPFVIASIIDRGIAGNDKTHIYLMGGLLVLFGIVGLVCALSAQYFAARAAVEFSSKIKRALFVKIQSLTFSEADKIGNSTLITRMTSDIDQIQTGVNLAIRLFLRSPFVVFGAMIMAFTIDFRSALIFAGVILVLSAVVFGIILVCAPLYKKAQDQLDTLVLYSRESLSGVRVIRAFNKEKDGINKFNAANEILNRMQNFTGRISALLNPLTFVIINAALIILIATGAIQADTGRISQGDLVALVNLMSQILVELIKLANLIITVTKSVACANRINEMLEKGSAFENGNCEVDISCPTAIEFNDVSLSYNGEGKEAVSGINFSVKKGSSLGIIGGTGSGKSTVAMLIDRFYDATKGSVKVFGTDVKELDIGSLRDKIGFVLQKPFLFSESIKENIKIGATSADDVDVKHALESSLSYDFVEKKENGMDTQVSSGGTNLSGGQKQRLTIARALVRKPEILILDDSSSALDYATEKKLKESVASLDYSPTVVTVSQRASSVMKCDSILVLDDGRQVAFGDHEHLMKTCDVYKEIYYSQFEREANA